MPTVKLKKWGNSYGIRIPKAIIDELELTPNDCFEIRTKEGEIHLQPVSCEGSLEELLAQVTADNLHAEVDFGPAAGHEIW